MALDSSAFPCKAIHSPRFLCAGLHAHVNSVGRNRCRVAAATHGFGNSHNIFCLHANKPHVLGIGTHVSTGDEFSIHAIHKAAKTPEQDRKSTRLNSSH